MNSTVVHYLSQFQFFHQLLAMMGKEYLPLLSLIIFLLVVLIMLGALSLVGGLGTYAERKISADMQARYGPNRVGPFGLLQFLADGIKMFLKEDTVPRSADRLIFTIAPIFCLAGVFGTIAVLPFSSGFMLTDLNVGIFYLLGVSSLVGIGVFLGGYASNSKWSMLGGMRGASQIISYEIPVTITILAVVMLAGGLSLQTLVNSQGAAIWHWNFLHNPFMFVGFFIFFIGALAETNRAPFDLPEAESELVSGYHTEYSGMRFAFFALAEYIEIFVVCAVATALFLGGYHVPFGFGGEAPLGQVLQVVTFASKTFALYYVVIWVRWTLPRLRVDQLMTLCWKYLTPIALFNLIGTIIWLYLTNGRSIVALIFG
ncbi:MAG: NADH-quinone oxidoreductase subunit NuoH [Bdellovibrionales bacterium]|jgi:NADH-quinone oxidoreductase subunit H|nr:NADH-quinone oxidoreductase subunit NuoH [Bdellovibrionales bacterium]MBT3526376.1 NADH-quinone oxidoreductase subunit NuoH [Bdellovibrionales bacterium]MBT7668452.1 NADH-quinone oxidoreductase subunit NuoH [Bdellovibrionales bacterium]MBT7768306.1 NADH-quinone oxidoreductase subunit NuoH [Bdellovibrionales bacterium]